MGRCNLLAAALMIVIGAPVAGQTFIGQNFAGSSPLLQPIPPDTMGAVGIDYFVELNNALFQVYRKSDGALVQSASATQFWTNAGAPPTSRSVDPRILYDPHARRWYASAMDNPPNPNSFLFAISSSADPTQPWTGFKIDSDTDDSNFADFPMLSFTGEGVFVSAVMPPITASGSRTAFLVFPKSDLLQPIPSIANMTKFEDVPQTTAGPVPQLAIDASNSFGTNLPVLSMSSAGGGTLVVAEITPPGAPAINNLGSISAPAAQPPTVVQPGAPVVPNLEANDWRFSANAVLHNGEVFAVQSVDDGSALGRAAVRFLRIDPASMSVLESAVLIDPAGRAMTFPSIAVNDFGDVVIGVTGTSTTEFASSYAIVGKTTGGVTTFNQPLLLRAGNANYVRLDSLSRNRWGDYSATTVDPADPGIFWTTQEFVSGLNNWSTQVTELIVLAANEARWASLAPLGSFDDPTMWQTAHGGAPLTTDDVVISRATDPSGVSPLNLFFPPHPPGVYVNHSASIRQGDVRLELGGNQWDLATDLEVGPYFGSPQATISNGTINSGKGNIANRPTAVGRLTLNNVHWNVNQVNVGSAIAAGAGSLPGGSGGEGSLTIDNGSQVNVALLMRIWKRGAVNLNSGVLTASLIRHTDGGSFNFNGGTLHVTQFNGELVNAGGTLAPGTSIGATNVILGYFQQPGGTLAIELGGTAPSDYDRLSATVAGLDGMLVVSLLAGFAPSLGNVFEIVSAGTVSGTFATSAFPPIGLRLDWHTFYSLNSVKLAVVPKLAGDYNANGVVDAADYVVWRNSLGQTGAGLAADGDFNAVVNDVDYTVWRAHFGQAIPGSGAAVPEPAAIGLIATVIGGLFVGRCRRRRRAHSTSRRD